MQMTDIILKKRDGFELSKEEIEFFIKNYVNNIIPDYQASALAMAIYFQGMNKKEISFLTDSMLHSGEIIDLSSINGVKIDCTNEFTIFVNAPPTTTPTAISRTLPLEMNSLNSLKKPFFSFSAIFTPS